MKMKTTNEEKQRKKEYNLSCLLESIEEWGDSFKERRSVGLIQNQTVINAFRQPQEEIRKQISLNRKLLADALTQRLGKRKEREK